MANWRMAARIVGSASIAGSSGYWIYWGVLRHLAAGIEAVDGPNVFREDATAGITMFFAMVEMLPVAVIAAMGIFALVIWTSGRYGPLKTFFKAHYPRLRSLDNRE